MHGNMLIQSRATKSHDYFVLAVLQLKHCDKTASAKSVLLQCYRLVRTAFISNYICSTIRLIVIIDPVMTVLTQLEYSM